MPALANLCAVSAPLPGDLYQQQERSHDDNDASKRSEEFDDKWKSFGLLEQERRDDEGEPTIDHYDAVARSIEPVLAKIG